MNKPTIDTVHDWVLKLHSECEKTMTGEERKEQQKYATMVQHPGDKIFLSKMLDESSQIRDTRKLAERIKVLVDRYGIPEFFNTRDNLLFRLYQSIGYHFGFIAIPIIKKRLRKDTSRVIIDEARPHLTQHLAHRFKDKIGQNVNLLGEVVLGNKEADHRYHHYLEALESADINYISVKISGIYAQTHALNYAESFPELTERLSALYRKAIENPYQDEDGQTRAKFINLDMEEYKDAHFTLRLFKEVLSKPEFKNYSAGIVVQAYLPDAYEFQTELLEFARKRVAEGGAPIKMRLVKGCNLEMETVISSLRGWKNPIRASKVEVDANYLHLLERALLPENAACVHLGVASHNLFTIGYAYLLSQYYGTTSQMTFEMLEGMANHLWRAQKALGNRVILYTPVVKDEHFLNAVSYLVRRLDENTGPENFLSYSFNLKPGTETWDFLKKQFETAFSLKDTLSHKAVRVQDRNKPYAPVYLTEKMQNEPDTDFDLAANQQWVEGIIRKWKKSEGNVPEEIPVQIGNTTTKTDDVHIYEDHCQENVLLYKMSKAGVSEIERVINIAETDPTGWSKTTLTERNSLLQEAANNLAALRGDLIGCMCAVTGKSITEGDVEVSEAIDYARFYGLTMKKFKELKDVEISPKGTVLVISPWNFPCAIPVGGITAALAGGNRVILKPATVAAPVAWLFAEAFWKAGIPKEVLQVVITDRPALQRLTTHPAIRHIILTGGTDTAQAITKANPATPLSAETGGKNVIILTASADRDHAIQNIVTSAFGNAGQKCSACSLVLVEQSVYDDPVFREKLIDATTSLKTGSIWNPGNIVGPMITNNNEKLLEALSHLEAGESWLVPPRFIDEKKYILSPCIKWGVAPNHYSFRTELFGPMLSVSPIKDLEEGIRLVNSLDYGLTSGLQSLDEREQKMWKEQIMAGNLYINRGITGAIVNRQPFGGMKLSAFGGGLKAGGPNYCSCFVHIRDKEDSRVNYLHSYHEIWKEEFAHARDINKLYGEQNVLRYLPLKKMALRIMQQDGLEEINRIVCAAKTCGTPLTISIDAGHPLEAEIMKTECPVQKETLTEFIEHLGEYERIRTCSPEIPAPLYQAAAAKNKYIATAPPVKQGRLELLHYIKEQSISFEYHRYGSISEVPAVE